MTPQAITIRRAAPEDVPMVIELLERYYSEWSVWEHDPPERVRHYVEQPLPFGYLLAEHDGATVGCVMLRCVASMDSAGECKRLFVTPEARRLGLASKLMDRLESLATVHHLEWVYLDSEDQFAVAISLYRKRGYESCERFNQNSQSTVFFRKHLVP